MGSNGEFVAQTTTDESGNYRFDNLAPGNYTVVETLPDGFVPTGDRNADNVSRGIQAVIGAGENNVVEPVFGEINGRVWGDRNEDNIEGEFEPGIAGVTVELLQNGEVVDRTVSDSNGVYQFTDITPGGGYQVFFDRTSFPSSYQGGFATPDIGDSTTDSDADVDTGETALLNLGPNALINDFDAGLRITEPNPIEGTAVPDALEGTAMGDAISGYKGQDTLTGGDGDDRFIYTETSDGVDIITDFTPGSDLIDLSQIIDEELAISSSDPIGDGYVVLDDYGAVGTMIQVDFDNSGELFAKDVVFLDGVSATDINPDTDLIL